MQEKELVLIIFSACIVLLAILIGFIAFISFLYQKRQQAFLGQLEHIKSDYERELLKSQLEVQEQTLQHISMEIHDNIGQFISLAKLHLNTLELAKGTGNAETLDYAVDLLSKAMDDLRDLSKSLSLEMIRAGGLVYAIESQVTQLKKTSRYVIDFQVVGSYHYLEEQKEIILFRILQESINNIVRHAAADKVRIVLDCTPKAISMLINDDGKGFDAEKRLPNLKADRRSGGINHMMARAKLIDADFCLSSTIGQGTQIRITVPFNQHYETSHV